MEDREINRSDVLAPIIERLHSLKQLMECQNLYNFFATSVLIIYEGDTKHLIRKPNDMVDIRLVDFAHAYEKFPKNPIDPDHNTLFGISKLIEYLERLKVSEEDCTANVL